jgi:hypothetical protein
MIFTIAPRAGSDRVLLPAHDHARLAVEDRLRQVLGAGHGDHVRLVGDAGDLPRIRELMTLEAVRRGVSGPWSCVGVEAGSSATIRIRSPSSRPGMFR